MSQIGGLSTKFSLSTERNRAAAKFRPFVMLADSAKSTASAWARQVAASTAFFTRRATTWPTKSAPHQVCLLRAPASRRRTAVVLLARASGAPALPSPESLRRSPAYPAHGHVSHVRALSWHDQLVSRRWTWGLPVFSLPKLSPSGTPTVEHAARMTMPSMHKRWTRTNICNQLKPGIQRGHGSPH